MNITIFEKIINCMETIPSVMYLKETMEVNKLLLVHF